MNSSYYKDCQRQYKCILASKFLAENTGCDVLLSDQILLGFHTVGGGGGGGTWETPPKGQFPPPNLDNSILNNVIITFKPNDSGFSIHLQELKCCNFEHKYWVVS